MFDKLVDRAFGNWQSPRWALQAHTIDLCSRNALLAVRVYVKLQNSRGLKPGHTRKDFVRHLEAAVSSRAAA